MSKYFILILATLLATGCSKKADLADAYGNFEATTVTVGSEAQGRLLFFNVEEGRKLKAGQLIGIVDTTQLHLQKLQIEASIGTLPSKLRNSLADIEVLKKQKANLSREKDRVARLVDKKAATTKQLDDITGQIEVVEKQIGAIRATTQTGNRAILAEKEPLLAQIDVLNERIRKSYIYNPVDGTVLTKMSESQEIVGPGAPLYRIGQLDTLDLRIYADAVQLQSVHLGQTIEVLVDDGAEGFRKMPGRVSWISEQAEFTPKSIQTKEDRVNLVYAIKARVANQDGLLKIGMPAEVNFSNQVK